ncbi:recombinase RecA [Peribacillus frigoritolerans]|uniref:Protein RecA n=1 Tax=Peribacillus castrilensis TaxID=2897690 RepID=A0AAW9NM38_9BACI|nr:DNA recombination/repair protein RecA [Peribacillus castrilensis]
MDETQKDRQLLLNQIRKEFGDTSMFLLGDTNKLDVEVRSSGSLMLDLALGGGYPKGRVVELRGSEKAGKTTLLNLAIAEAQRTEPEKENAIIDLENTWIPAWAKTLGMDPTKLFISQPDTYAEKVFQLLEHLIKSGKYAIIGLDSVAGLVPKGEFEEEDWDKESRVGGTSKINAKAMRKLVNSGLLTASGTTLIFINQLRDKIGGFSMYGQPTDTVGGRSLKHAYSMQLDVSIGEYFKKGTGDATTFLGQKTKVKVAKNKIAPPFRTANLDLYYESGLDRIKESIQIAKEIGILSGTSWLTLVNPMTGEIYQDEEGKDLKWQGVDKTRLAMIDDIQNNEAKIYTILFDLIQEMIRG